MPLENFDSLEKALGTRGGVHEYIAKAFQIGATTCVAGTINFGSKPHDISLITLLFVFADHRGGTAQ